MNFPHYLSREIFLVPNWSEAHCLDVLCSSQTLSQWMFLEIETEHWTPKNNKDIEENKSKLCEILIKAYFMDQR